MTYRIIAERYLGDPVEQIGDFCIYANGTRIAWRNGKMHREAGPAVIYQNGNQEWHINGKCHRLDGPACINIHGHQNWYINDIYITDRVEAWIKENDFPDYTLWSDTQKMMFRLAFAGIAK